MEHAETSKTEYLYELIHDCHGIPVIIDVLQHSTIEKHYVKKSDPILGESEVECIRHVVNVFFNHRN